MIWEEYWVKLMGSLGRNNMLPTTKYFPDSSLHQSTTQHQQKLATQILNGAVASTLKRRELLSKMNKQPFTMELIVVQNC